MRQIIGFWSKSLDFRANHWILKQNHWILCRIMGFYYNPTIILQNLELGPPLFKVWKGLMGGGPSSWNCTDSIYPWFYKALYGRRFKTSFDWGNGSIFGKKDLEDMIFSDSEKMRDPKFLVFWSLGWQRNLRPNLSDSAKSCSGNLKQLLIQGKNALSDARDRWNWCLCT